MERLEAFLSLFFFFFIFWCCCSFSAPAASQKDATVVDVGVILDSDSPTGKKNWASISLAVDDFYASHGINFTTRLVLHPRDSQNGIIGAASAAIDLLKNVKVQAIVGPTTSSQTEFVAVLGNKTKVPVVSFSATTPSLASTSTPYLVRATLSDSAQASPIAAVVKLYGWREVVLVYEDTDYGSGIVPSLIDAFNSVGVRVPYRCVVPKNATDAWLAIELYKLMSMQTRVFVLHMIPDLGERLFLKAQAVGLMRPGYAWITTDGLTNALSTLGPASLAAMEGVLGVRPYIPPSPALSSFAPRWLAAFLQQNPALPSPPPPGPTLYQLRAYDAAWALALAAEAAASQHQQRPPRVVELDKGGSTNTDLSRLGISDSGPHLLAALLNTQFRGLCGNFNLVGGQLQPSTFEIVNVMGEGGVRRVGFSSGSAITKQLKDGSGPGLRSVIWPGDSREVPRGWEIPVTGKKLQVMVPVKEGFTQFVNVEKEAATGRLKVTGYCIDIFEAVMDALPYSVPFEYVEFNGSSSSYDGLISQVYFQKADVVVGDTTIIANRSKFVDFTLPYTVSGVSMVVPLQEDKSTNAWIFLRPLTTDLWLASLAFFFFTGFVVWVIEHRINAEFRGPPSQQMGTIFYFAFSTLVFAHKERLESNLSRFTVIVWAFVVLILTSSYTASLTSMLTVQQLQPTVDGASQLLKNGDFVGYQEGSFVKGLLINQLKFNENKLKNYSTTEEYAQALSLGSKNGGVAAIFDELPYLKLFLSENCATYAMLGQTYKTDGFGFIFPRGSPLVSDVSRAILNLTEGDAMAGIERKWFGDQTDCPTVVSGFTSGSLSFGSFGGLFLMTGCVSSFAFLVFLITFVYKEWGELKAVTSRRSLWRRIKEWGRHYDRKDLSSHTFKDYATSVNDRGSSHNSQGGQAAAVASPYIEGSQSPISITSNISGMEFESPDDVRSFEESSAITALEIAETGEGS